jgi:hypothetical protein
MPFNLRINFTNQFVTFKRILYYALHITADVSAKEALANKITVIINPRVD